MRVAYLLSQNLVFSRGTLFEQHSTRSLRELSSIHPLTSPSSKLIKLGGILHKYYNVCHCREPSNATSLRDAFFANDVVHDADGNVHGTVAATTSLATGERRQGQWQRTRHRQNYCERKGSTVSPTEHPLLALCGRPRQPLQHCRGGCFSFSSVNG